jgi:hypothetical protein
MEPVDLLFFNLGVEVGQLIIFVVAAICRGHGVSEFLMVDREFSRFPTLLTRNPLLD